MFYFIALQVQAFLPPPPRFFTAGGAGRRVGGASEEVVVWEVTVKGGALEAGTKRGGPMGNDHVVPHSPQSSVEKFAGKRTT